MITPILISSISWGTYLFFAVSKLTWQSLLENY
jgi:hypothetical protein